MKYDIAKRQAPKMPELGKGTECLKLPLSLASKGINQTLVPLFLPFRRIYERNRIFVFRSKIGGTYCQQVYSLLYISHHAGRTVGLRCRLGMEPRLLVQLFPRRECPYLEQTFLLVIHFADDMLQSVGDV